MKYLQNITQTGFTQSANYALSLADAKLHLNILDTSFDDLIQDYLYSAHQMMYLETSLLISGTVTGQLDVLQDFFIDIYEVNTIVIKYYDSNNTLQTWNASNYILNGQNVEIIGTAPTTYDRDFPYVVEIATKSNTNPMVTQAIRMIVGDFFESRQSDAMGSVNELTRATKWQLNLISKSSRF